MENFKRRTIQTVSNLVESNIKQTIRDLEALCEEADDKSGKIKMKIDVTISKNDGIYQSDVTVKWQKSVEHLDGSDPVVFNPAQPNLPFEKEDAE